MYSRYNIQCNPLWFEWTIAGVLSGVVRLGRVFALHKSTRIPKSYYLASEGAVLQSERETDRIQGESLLCFHVFVADVLPLFLE